jgi:hypothetical protein
MTALIVSVAADGETSIGMVAARQLSNATPPHAAINRMCGTRLGRNADALRVMSRYPLLP